MVRGQPYGGIMEQNKEVSKTTKQLVEMVGKLEPQEFIGVCKILGIEIYDVVDAETGENLNAYPEKVSVGEYLQDAAHRLRQDKDDNESQTREDMPPAGGTERNNLKIQVRPAEDLVKEVIIKISELNREQSRNLKKLLKPATKGR